MPDLKKDLFDAKTNSDPDLNFTYNELLMELASNTPPILDQNCEVTADMLAEQSHISAHTALRRLRKMELAGILEMVIRRTQYGNKVKAWKRKENTTG